MFLFLNSQKELIKLRSQKDEVVAESKQVVDQVGKLIILPQGETPAVATITDVERLKQNQPFFSQAKDGDKVLIYTKAKKAILYRPAENKIVEVAPVNLGVSPSAIETPKLSPTMAPKR